MPNPNAAQAPVTVIGLGLMGQALAAAFLKNGHPTTVWNRSADKADELVATGAALAASVKDAVEASPLVVVCVSDYAAAHELLDPLAGSLAGRTLVNLGSASSSQARDTAKWAKDHEAAGYLDGAIMAFPAGIGTDAAVLLHSGPKSAYDEHEATLKALAPAATLYLGEDPGLASLHDVALLGVMWGIQNSFLHGAALLGAAGVKATDFATLATPLIAVVAQTVDAYAAQVDAGEYPGDDASVATHVGSMAHLLDESKELGVNTELPALFKAFGDRAMAAGHASSGYAALIEQFRKPSA
ncbi:NAD(P)-dependent oxidoreductase [Actinokineospora iranica]|uniref:3-hydroxyisobutyrate dehydrogenase n=1 Tax=Actinokineospora iranica TaxID=1271860 RepID=A0A1G6XRT6_9PSEU|nr:NAD(P)-binding domain-containing protein [Actinokineospora iranica]SDD80443.1 3-hydroxyisobutyrate dehydrogenase [Actinokineospora iranica]